MQPKLVALCLLGLSGCLARGNSTLLHPSDGDGGPNLIVIDGGPADAASELPQTAPHAVLGVDPPHGPFNGGQHAIVRGNGFTSQVRVWFGGTEVPASDVVPIDPGRVQVVVPAGHAGAVDVATQDGSDASTRSSLTGGYTYDQFYADPSSGPTSGGTVTTLYGDGTHWDDQTTAFVDLNPCQAITVKSPTDLECTTPQGTPGSKTVRVTTSDGVSVDVLDAFSYVNSNNGYRGGLSGSPLQSQLKVLALDDITGNAIAGATVVAGDDLATASVKQTDASGVAVFQDPTLGPARSVTVAKSCYQPITFVDVPVDTVTAYLDPVLSPSCVSKGDPPPVGGTPVYEATINGQIVWPYTDEFKREGWSNVPQPKGPDEKLVAYVQPLSSDATRSFSLPGSSNAVTPASQGSVGFSYSLTALPGNLTLYALAGIENDALQPPLFTAYAMGVAKGVTAEPGGTTSDVYIPIDAPLNHALEVTAAGPEPTSRGPDRVQATVAVSVANLGYALLPNGAATELIPVASPFNFEGVPALSGSLSGSSYVATASAVTGATAGTPDSVVGLYQTNDSSQIVNVTGFVEIPALVTPPTNGAWNGQDLQVSWIPGGADVSLTVFDVESGGGLVAWTVALPGSETSAKLPDLDVLGSDLGLIHGPVSITVSAAHIDNFDYGSLRDNQLGKSGWDAYARDVFYAHY
jgi:IPT/TIG domain